MKKFLKLQAKKSMSLFLAVVMLMSCWVWVAPEAKAADSPHEGYYWVEVRCKLTDWASTDETATNEWVVTHAGGTTTLTAGPSTAYNNGSNDSSGNYVIAKGWVKGFPTGLKHTFATVKDDCGDAKGDGFRVENPAVYVGAGPSATMKAIAESGMVYSAVDGNYDIDGWKSDAAPYADSVTSAAATEKKTISVPSLGATTNGSASFTKGGVYDQYGVKIAELDGYNLYSDNAGSTTAYTKEENGVWVSGTTVYASADAQKGIPNASGSQKIYLFGEGSGVKGCLAEITLTYPSYTLTVNPVGSVTASGFNPTITLNNNSTQTGNWTHNGPYSSAAATYPNGEATATGYTFKGFWTTKQPTTGDAGTGASEATFAAPVDQATFDTYKAQEGATVDGSYVTLSDGKKYFNAGTQWDAATHREILGNNTFYGWWIPKDIVVKFYDVDGAYLGSKTAKYGATPAADWYLNPKDGYNAGAYDYQGFAGKWRDITGIEVVEGSYTFGALEVLTLTPIYTNKTYSDKYQVNFVNPADGNNISGNSKEYEYRYVLEGTDIPTVAVPSVLVNDPGFSYVFGGWTSQKPSKGNYHTVAMDDTSITENTDWVVREEITYYAIFRSTVKEYLVNFNYTDSTGAAKTESMTVAYGSALATPNVVNRTYATGGYGYTLEGWDYQTNTGATVMLGADATLVFDNTKVFITTNNLAPNGTPIVFTANYDEGQPTPYTVTFKFKDEAGKDKVITDEVYHGYAITQDTVDRVTVPAQYDDGTALYTFSNLWKVTEGTADKAEYTKDEFTSFKPVSHVTFEALYGEGTPFYTVTYIDGAKTYEERVLKGDNVPAWFVDGEEYVPAKADTETGKYEFAGWFDAEQTDKDFAQTNGTEYTTASIVNSDLVLYPQFKFEPFKFTIKFMNFDGTVQLAAAEVEAGQSFEAAYTEAQRAAQLRDADEIYSYTFIGWDNKVPDNYLCEGKDMTYTALYRPNYVYYKAYWYNSADEMNDAGLLATTNHTYNGAVYAPSVAFDLPDATKAGYTVVFDGWYYLKDGVATEYQRGMKITSAMSFYATYKEVANALTLTTNIDGVTANYPVEYGSTVTIGDPVDGYVDTQSHNKFAGWYTDEAYTTEFDFDTKITANTTIYAKFEQEAHSKTMKELVSAPTYYATGSEIIWCACNREETEETVEIDVLTDTVAPTGTIYLGTQGSWSSTDTIGAAATDNDEVAFYANADTDIILTINDTGDVNDAYNPAGEGKGVAVIQGIISTGVFGADTTEIAGIQTIFTDSTETLNNTANYVIKLGTYAGLVDGQTYIAYYYAKDKADNVLNKNVRTAKFIYDTTAPEFTIAGDNNEAEAGAVTYCGKATVTGVEVGATLKINGEAVELTTTSAAGIGTYDIKEAGNYLVTVTDKAGNSTTKKIKVTDGHDEIETTKAVTCTEDGYEKIICAVCNKVIKEETTTAEGHKYGEVTTVDPTCTTDGYDVKTCSVCGDEDKTNEVAAAGHTHTGYTVITAPTCTTAGKKISNCDVCGKDTITQSIPADPENGHVYGAVKTLKATCDEAGEKYQNCKYCFAKVTLPEEVPALNHKDTGRYTKVTTAATCHSEGVKTTYCKACDEPMGTETIAKTAHTLVLIKYDTYMQYECQIEGCGHTEGREDIAVKAEYTVTFKGAGEEGADLTFTVTEGESIAATAVADQTKAKDEVNEYTFAGWKAEDGKVIKLPVKVTKNETYTAEFTATKRIYTHRFLVPEDVATFAATAEGKEYAVIVGGYNDTNKKPAVNPVKASTATEEYKFIGWLKVGEKELAKDFTMTGDATFVAQFATTYINFGVIFYDDDQMKVLYDAEGNANADSKVDVTEIEGYTTPVKAPDADNHYVFAGWKLGDTVYAEDYAFGPFTETTRIYATYEGTGHSFAVVNDETKTWAATCIKEGQTTEACSVCGFEKVTTIPVTEHVYGEADADGVRYCTTVGCDAKLEPDAIVVSIKFMEGTNLLKNFAEVKEGESKTFTAPAKTATAQYEYKFLKWTDAEGNTVAETAEITVTAGKTDAVYYAVYEAIERIYNVSYVDESDKVIGETYKIAYNGTVPAAPKFELAKKYDDNNHYTFTGWTVAAGTVVTEDILIRPIIVAEGHEYDMENGKPVNATCTSAGGTEYKCACGKTFIKANDNSAVRPHNWGEEIQVDPTYDAPGSITKICADCGFEDVKVLPQLKRTEIRVTVKNAEGKTVEGAKVDLYKDGTWIAVKYSDANGLAVFEVEEEGKYTVLISGVAGAQNNQFDVNTGESVESKPSAIGCECSCHRNGFWGAVFRFFQKIVKFFTGEIRCCADPDGRY